VPYDRDVRAFDERAPGYQSGRLGRVHRDIADQVVELALSCAPAPRRVLDVGSGTGYALRRLAGRLPAATELVGIDPAPGMVRVAGQSADDRRLRFLMGAAEQLPAADGTFDLVISITSFDHWAGQQTGIAECARVLAPGGCLVLADLFSALLWPTLLTVRRGKARTRSRAAGLVTAAGLRAPRWHRVYPFVQAMVAVK
jgi:ubiquinone/menaquinone biosynthesis C-methylase UbiE